MDTSTLIMIVVAVLVVMLALLYPVFVKAKKVDLTGKIEDRPEWMRETPPKATTAATRAEGEGVTVFNLDEGEKLAAPFAEQIEDILRARLNTDPDLKRYEVDLGTAADGNLEIWVNGKQYREIKNLPDERLKQVFREAIGQWNKK
jgi:hypothetical protein